MTIIIILVTFPAERRAQPRPGISRRVDAPPQLRETRANCEFTMSRRLRSIIPTLKLVFTRTDGRVVASDGRAAPLRIVWVRADRRRRQHFRAGELIVGRY